MAAKWEAKSFELSDINGGNRYENGNFLDADAINAAIEGAGYAVERAEDARSSAASAASSAIISQQSATTAQQQVSSAQQSAANAEGAALASKSASESAEAAASEAKETAASSLEYQEETAKKVEYLVKKLSNIQSGIPELPFVTDDSVAYEKKVPANALPYAFIGDIAGRTILETDANLFDPSKVSDEYGNIVVSGDIVTVNQVSADTVLTLGEICPDIEIGKTYRVSIQTGFNGSSMVFGSVSVGGNSWKTFTATEELLNSIVIFNTEYTPENPAGFDDYRIMISYSALVKPYVPFIELDKSYNLFDIKSAVGIDGVTVNTAASVVSITVNVTAYIPFSKVAKGMVEGETYTLSFNTRSGSHNVSLTGATKIRDENGAGNRQITFLLNNKNGSIDITPIEDVPTEAFIGDHFVIAEDTEAKKYIPFGKWYDAKVTRIESLDQNGVVVASIEIPKEVQSLPAYGKGVNGFYNTVQFGITEISAKYIQRTKEDNTTMVAVTTDISDIINPYNNLILVSPNGKIRAVNEKKVPVKFVVGYQTEA